MNYRSTLDSEACLKIHYLRNKCPVGNSTSHLSINGDRSKRVLGTITKLHNSEVLASFCYLIPYTISFLNILAKEVGSAL